MSIKTKLIDRIELSDFLIKHGLDVLVEEKIGNGNVYFIADFKQNDVEKKHGSSFLTSTYKRGFSEHNALMNFANSISNSTLVQGAYTKNRREIEVPIIVIDEILKKAGYEQ